MENKLIIGIIASVIIGLTSWNLKETYEISKTIVLLKEKVSQIEKTLDKKTFNKNKTSPIIELWNNRYWQCWDRSF